jgi:exopolysaccharide biosynthesis protein
MPHYPPDTPDHFRLRKAYWRWRQAGFWRLLAMARRRALNPAYLAGVCLWLTGCAIQTAQPSPTPPLTSLSDADWERLAPGIERRVYRPSSGFLVRITALRINPTQVEFRVHYQPGQAQFLSEWADNLPAAAVIVNTNFFDSDDRITGTLFADGVQYGDPYRRRGGMFYIQDGLPGLQSNLVQPYAGEQYDQAVQAFPMLVTDGQQSYHDTRPDRSTRRTVIGQDRDGRVVILVTTFGGITLLDMADFLVHSDLELTDALNLDGGGSTLLQVRAGETEQLLSSFDPVPAVLAAYPR